MKEISIGEVRYRIVTVERDGQSADTTVNRRDHRDRGEENVSRSHTPRTAPAASRSRILKERPCRPACPGDWVTWRRASIRLGRFVTNHVQRRDREGRRE